MPQPVPGRFLAQNRTTLPLLILPQLLHFPNSSGISHLFRLLIDVLRPPNVFGLETPPPFASNALDIISTPVLTPFPPPLPCMKSPVTPPIISPTNYPPASKPSPPPCPICPRSSPSHVHRHHDRHQLLRLESIPGNLMHACSNTPPYLLRQLVPPVHPASTHNPPTASHQASVTMSSPEPSSRITEGSSLAVRTSSTTPRPPYNLPSTPLPSSSPPSYDVFPTPPPPRFAHPH